jgi:Fuc2NAc and GlcNAc transferase
VLKLNCTAGFLCRIQADEFKTMIVRIKKGDNLLKPHRSHIYQLLANEKGIPHWKVSIGYALLQAVVGLSVLGVKPIGLFAVVFLLGLWSSAFSVFSAFVRRSVAQMS